MLKKIGLDWFILALVAMIFFAWLYPDFGALKGPASLSSVAGYGVTVIFFFYGLRLDLQQLLADLGNWRLHLLVQLTTFIGFPLVVLASYPFFKGTVHEPLWLGAFYCAALPSTVSSSVVMVSIARGNIPAAIFNASISGLIGVFVTPLWMGIFLLQQPGSIGLAPVFLKLFLQVLLPVALGLLLNRRLSAFAQRTKNQLRYFDQATILLIIYTSFCDSFSQGVFQHLAWSTLWWLFTAMLGLFALSYLIIGTAAKLMRFNQADLITALFCGSKKSLVHGTVMSKILFSPAMAIGILLLPIMVYHALQLILASLIAKRFEKQTV
ncbi:MAG: bile acid:sodium symporter family protein [Chitinophagales bacterium]|nr:bile acid:sodium symporter family protein [Chitinophagales bacterium]